MFGTMAYGSRSFGSSATVLDFDFADIYITPEVQDIVVETFEPTVSGGEKVLFPEQVFIYIDTPTMITDVTETYDIEVDMVNHTVLDMDYTLVRNIEVEIVNDTFLVLAESGVEVERAEAWWSTDWLYRRYLSITAPPTGIEQDHPVIVEVSKQVLRQNKLRTDLKDFKVLELVSLTPEVWKLHPHALEEETGKFILRFALPNAIDPDVTEEGRYFVYYGNKFLSNNILTPDYSWEMYPLTVPYTSPSITYTRFGVHWIDGASSEPLAKGHFRFWGSRIKLYANKGPGWGIIEIQVDNGEWTAYDLFHYTEQTDRLIFTQTDLEDTKHNIRFRVSGHKHPSASSTAVNITKLTYSKHGEFTNVKEQANSRLHWGAGLGGKS